MKIKIGDRVIVNDLDYLFAEQKGHVYEIDHEDGEDRDPQYWVELPDVKIPGRRSGIASMFYASEITRIEEGENDACMSLSAGEDPVEVGGVEDESPSGTDRGIEDGEG